MSGAINMTAITPRSVMINNEDSLTDLKKSKVNLRPLMRVCADII
jgi:hypothetical protein